MRITQVAIWIVFLVAMMPSPATTDETLRPARLLLAENGVTRYTIVIPEDATEVEKTAAKELQSHLERATGATFPVCMESESLSGMPSILIGRCRRAAELLPDVNIDDLADDAIILRTVGHDLILTGDPPRGPLYAVYTLLEDHVGCRWWTSTEGFIPETASLAIEPLDTRYAPRLVYREAFYRDTFDGVFAARMKCNGHHHRVPGSHGGQHRFEGFVHTFYPVLPPSRYFADHPEWYSEIKGIRTHDLAQLCLTNDAMRDEYVRVCRERLRRNPQAKFLSVSQNDWHGRCECAACRAVEDEEGGPSGPLLRFVNAVAAALEEEFPDVYVETLAYQYTRKPPLKARPRDNVVIRLCSIECCFVQPLAEGEHNAAFRADIEGWREVAPRLFVWDYVTNFSNYMVPHPNMRVLAPNLRYFVDNGVIGMFEQGDSQCGVGDFVRLRAWVLAHLMWDPTRDDRALFDEFLQGYYGPAAPHLAAYLDLIHDRGEQSGVYLRCFMPETNAWLTLDTLNEATRLFQDAMAAVADDPMLAERVRRERLVLDHVWLQRYHVLRRAAALENKPFLGPDDPQAACEEFIELCEKHRVGNWSENAAFADYARSLRDRFGEPATAPEACRDLPSTDWIDLQEFDFRLARPNDWAKIVTDPTASNRRAVRMGGGHNQWALQSPLGDDFDGGSDPWRCIVYARCDASVESGLALRTGIYDTRGKRSIVGREVAVNECNAGYVAIDLGLHRLRPGYYFYAAPPQRPGEVEAVYVDRIVLIRTPDPATREEDANGR